VFWHSVWESPLVRPGPACASGAEVYTEPYSEYISPTYSIGLSLDPVSIDYIAIDPEARGEQTRRPPLMWASRPPCGSESGGWGTHMPAQAGASGSRGGRG